MNKDNFLTFNENDLEKASVHIRKLIDGNDKCCKCAETIFEGTSCFSCATAICCVCVKDLTKCPICEKSYGYIPKSKMREEVQKAGSDGKL